jgi:ATP-dependent protease ClpP protease subunit
MSDAILFNQFWLYTVNPDADEPIVLITNHIGFDEEEGYGVMGDLFIKELLALDEYCLQTNKKRIQVWINSPGGIVDDGMSIYSAILRTQTKCDTYCVGIAASIAGVIFQAGRKRYMMENAYLMYHNPFGSDDKKSMNALTDSIVTMIAGRTKKTKDEVQKMLNDVSWIDAEQALKENLCDQIESLDGFNKKRTVSTQSDADNLWKESKNILNKFYNNSKSPTMSEDKFPYAKVAMKLGLNEQASSEAVLSELEKIVNKKNDAEKKCEDMEDEMDELKKKMEDAKKEHDKHKADYDDLKKQHDDLKKKMEDEDEDRKKKDKEAADKKKAEDEDKAKNYINQAAAKGLIPKDTDSIELWTKEAVADFDKVKALLERQPLNRKAAPIENKTNIDGSRKITSIEEAGKIKNIAAAAANKLRSAEKEFAQRKN